MKKTMLSILAGVLTLSMALASCGGKNDTPKDSGTNNATVTTAPVTSETPSDTKPDGAATTVKPDEPTKPEVKVGDSFYYNMAYYLDASVPSNATENDKRKFLQNISQGYARLDDEILVNDEDIYQLFWQTSDLGDTLRIPFRVSATGTYTVKFSLHMGGDFGTFQIYFDDDLISGNRGVDLYRSADGGLYDFDLGKAVLTEGDHELIFRLKGQNAMSAGRVCGISSMTLTVDSFETTPIERPDEPDTPEETSTTIKAAFLLDTAKTDNAGADLFVQNLSQGFARVDAVKDLNDSDSYQLFWANISVGDTLKLKLNVEKAGVYDLSMLSNRGGDYGKFSLTVNGKLLTEDYNLSDANGGGMLTTQLKNVVLTAGENELVFKCLDTNRANETKCVFAISTFVLEESELTTVKPALWLDAAKAANEGKELFVQDMSDSWKRLDAVADMNQEHSLQLFWGAISVGDELHLTMTVEEAGEYYLGFLSNRGGDYGTFEITINGVKVTDSYNLSDANGGGQLLTAFEGVRLSAGANEIVIKCVSTNRDNEPKCVFGITSISLACTKKA